MANCYIDFICQQQDITRHDGNVVAEGAANVLYARFYLCPKWDGLALFARFKRMAAVYDVPIIDGCARVPWEVVKYTGFEVSIFGIDGEGGRLTSERILVPVARSIDFEGCPPIPATPSLIDVLVKNAAAAEAAAEEASESAAAAAEGVTAAASSAAVASSAAENAAASVANTEEWELVMADGSTVKKVVCVR